MGTHLESFEFRLSCTTFFIVLQRLLACGLLIRAGGLFNSRTTVVQFSPSFRYSWEPAGRLGSDFLAGLLVRSPPLTSPHRAPLLKRWCPWGSTILVAEAAMT